ncbi:MAG: hypothetical protein AAF847_10080 [Bacteroidota bacterium]
MNTRSIYFLFALLLSVNCQTGGQLDKSPDTFLQSADEILYDSTIDDPDYRVCGNYIYQYFNDGGGLIYEGEKHALIETFEDQYVPPENAQDSGLVRIRFVVNCQGKSGRFRILTGNNYQAANLSTSITDQLLSITKMLDGWKVKQLNGKTIDYYQYLIFKIEAGKIVEILP